MAAYFFVDVLEITDQAKLEKYREGGSLRPWSCTAGAT